MVGYMGNKGIERKKRIPKGEEINKGEVGNLKLYNLLKYASS